MVSGKLAKIMRIFVDIGHIKNQGTFVLAVAFIDKHLALGKDGGLKTTKCSYINNNTSFWQGNISTKFIGKRVSWWQILDHMESLG